MSQIAIKNGLNISGKVTINRYRAGMVDHVEPLLQYLRELKESKIGKGNIAASLINPNLIDYFIEKVTADIEAIKAVYFIEKAVEINNLVMDSPGYGLDMIIQRMVGINTYSLNILWIEIGTGTTTPNVNDTALTTPTNRMAVSYQEDFATTDAIVQAYITDAALANGTYNEVGSFVDGNSGIGTGQIFNHALLSPAYVKVSGQDTTIQMDFSINNS